MSLSPRPHQGLALGRHRPVVQWCTAGPPRGRPEFFTYSPGVPRGFLNLRRAGAKPAVAFRGALELSCGGTRPV